MNFDTWNDQRFDEEFKNEFTNTSLKLGTVWRGCLYVTNIG